MSGVVEHPDEFRGRGWSWIDPDREVTRHLSLDPGRLLVQVVSHSDDDEAHPPVRVSLTPDQYDVLSATLDSLAEHWLTKQDLRSE